MTEARPVQTSMPISPSSPIWVLGAGRFGELAVKRLTRRLPNSDLAVIDLRRDKLDRLRSEYGSSRMSFLEADGLERMNRDDLPEDLWVVPAVPRHVAFVWFVNRLDRVGTVRVLPVPIELDVQVPNPYRVAEGTVYASHATFLCPDSCSEPEDVCTYTKRPRATNLFEIISRVEVPEYRSIVVRSRQLAPGVGGYPVAQLRKTLDQIRAHAGRFIIATSCRCHSVINAMIWEPRSEG
ncbi:MAG: hypothetical protein AB9873_12380 [Syntrophobacteraceae bacterium]